VNLQKASLEEKPTTFYEDINHCICPKTAVQEERERRERGDLSQVN